MCPVLDFEAGHIDGSSEGEERAKARPDSEGVVGCLPSTPPLFAVYGQLATRSDIILRP